MTLLASAALLVGCATSSTSEPKASAAPPQPPGLDLMSPVGLAALGLTGVILIALAVCLVWLISTSQERRARSLRQPPPGAEDLWERVGPTPPAELTPATAPEGRGDEAAGA